MTEFSPDERGEQIADHANEAVHFDFLIGPVILRAESDMKRGVQVAESMFDFGLSVISLHDLFAAPVMPIGHEYPEAEPSLDFCDFLLADFKAE